MKCKKAFDARKLSHSDLELLRISAVKRVGNGEGPHAVARGLGINQRTIFRWLHAAHYHGMDALKAKAISGRPTKLTARQMTRIARIVRDKNPQQLKFEWALWTLEMIRAMIANEYNVRLSEVSVSRLMKRLGFTPQRPLYRAWQQDPVLVDKWRKRDYPKIAARAKREKALIFFADESGIRSDSHAGKTWAPKGKTPVIQATGARFGFNMLSAVNAKGHFRFMITRSRINGSIFLTFLKRLISGNKRKIILVVDGHPIHRAKMITNFVHENSNRIELVFLPPYAPELNPDELAWAHVKRKTSRVPVTTFKQMFSLALGTLRNLQGRPEIVASFFRAPSCAYAA